MSEGAGFQFTDDAVPKAYEEVLVHRHVLAKALGLATSTRRLHPFNGNGAADPALDPARHAIDGELVDPGLRRGRRPNGHA